ncbi:MAG TPA: hypothetical protein PKW82_04800 [Spirochaetales bacterium]|nr:hypothetical protein [Spirochaetales bacterium]
MKLEEFLSAMRVLIEHARVERLAEDGKVVFLSDLHLGDRSRRDDFRRSEVLVAEALEGFYLHGNWRLVLNGDVEELQKFDLPVVRAAYRDLFDLFARFRDGAGLCKLVGNHDHALLAASDDEFPIGHALRLETAAGPILAFHGHQSNKFYGNYNALAQFIVRRVLSPLAIPNVGTRMQSERRWRAERRIYRAARELGMVVVAGHTHRPLFESHSKYDTLRWQLESLLRRYTETDGRERDELEALIRVYRDELRGLSGRELRRPVSRSLYEKEDLLVPAMFNSGSATGREGFTAVEIEGPTIALVHWCREGSARAYLEREAVEAATLSGTPWRRQVLARDTLEYVFARLRLLA